MQFFFALCLFFWYCSPKTLVQSCGGFSAGRIETNTSKYGAGNGRDVCAAMGSFHSVPCAVKINPVGGNSVSTAPSPASTPASGGLADNTAGMLAYITIIPAIIFLVMEPYNKNKFVRFHAFQNIFFAIALTVLWIVLMILGFVLDIIPILGWILHLLLAAGLGIGSLIVWVMLLIKANKGEKWKLPYIGEMAEKQANSV